MSCHNVNEVYILFSAQALSSSPYPGALAQEKGKTRDGGERDPEHQTPCSQNDVQGPPQLQDYGVLLYSAVQKELITAADIDKSYL